MKTSTVFINDNGQFVRCTGPTYSTPEVCDCMVEQPTPEELEQEAAYYAWLEQQMKQAVVVVDPVDFVDDDDQAIAARRAGSMGTGSA